MKIETIEGRLSSEGEYRGSGFTQEEVKSNLTAHGTYALTSGSFKNFTLMTKLFAWLGMKDYSTVDVREMAGHFEIENGQAKVENWALASSYGNFLANGTIGLNGTVNLDIVTTLQKKYSDMIRKYHAEWLLPIDDQGRATIDIKAAGTLESPSFSLDKSRIQERLKGKIIDDFVEKKKELEEKLKLLTDQTEATCPLCETELGVDGIKLIEAKYTAEKQDKTDHSDHRADDDYIRPPHDRSALLPAVERKSIFDRMNRIDRI